MTRKHFKFFADEISRLPQGEREIVARHMADMLAKTNPRFSREKFLAACKCDVLAYQHYMYAE